MSLMNTDICERPGVENDGTETGEETLRSIAVPDATQGSRPPT